MSGGKGNQWWLAPGAEENRCTVVVFDSVDRARRRCKGMAIAAGLCKRHERRATVAVGCDHCVALEAQRAEWELLYWETHTDYKWSEFYRAKAEERADAAEKDLAEAKVEIADLRERLDNARHAAIERGER